VSIFKFRKDINQPGYSYDELIVEDSEEVPGALSIQCTDRNEACGVELPREQVEKLVKVLSRWLKP
jgi:hypothetical protein